MSELVPGELTLMLEFGSGLQDRDLFGKQDPYCILKCGTLTRQSQICHKGGKDPSWNEQFAFTLGTTESEISLQVFDKDKIKLDDVIGKGVVHLSRVRYSGKDTQQVPLTTHKGKQQGFVQVTLTFVKNQTLQDVTATYGTTAYKPPPSIYVGLHSMPSSSTASTPSLLSSVLPSPFGGVPTSPYGLPSPYAAQPYPYAAQPYPISAQPNPYATQPYPYGTQPGYPVPDGPLHPHASFPPVGYPPHGYPPSAHDDPNLMAQISCPGPTQANSRSIPA